VDQALDTLTQTGGFAVEAAKQRDAAFQIVVDAFRSAASDPFILLLSNMQWADKESIALFTTLAQDIGDKPILLIGTYKMEELTERDGATHPLVEAMGELMTEGLFSTIELGPLSPGETEEMISSIVGSGSPPKRLVVALFSSTKGNPLFLREMIMDMLDRGVIDPSDPNWGDNIDMDQVTLPSTLKEATGHTLDQLDRKELSMLELMSSMGMTFDESIAVEITGMGEKEVFDILLRLAEKRLVEEMIGHYTIYHPFISETTLDSMPDIRRIELHRKIAEALAARGQDEFLVGHHAFEGELWEMAAENLMTAAKRAYGRYALQTARDTGRTVVLCAVKSGREGIAAEAKLLLGKVSYDMGDWNEALPLLTEAASGGKANAAEAFLYMAHLERNRSHWEIALVHYQRALLMTTEDTVLAADAYRGMGKVCWRKGDMDEAVGNLEKGIVIAEKLDEKAMLGSCKIDLGSVYHNLGRAGDSISSHQEGVD
ncbi:MAG: hypothetical protein KAT70_09355, partial [Thermoplasmata archaeon]|nr:hypothetical protein [Thermoplasmata archaeon]